MDLPFLDAIKANRPNLAKSSITTYNNLIKRTAKKTGIDILTVGDLIGKEPEILKHLMDITANKRRAYLSAIIVAIDHKGDKSESVEKALANYREQSYMDNEEYKKNDNKQELTESQKANVISWDKVLEIYKNLKTEATPLFKLKELNKKQFETLQKFVLLSCYVLIPVRRSQDFCDFKIREFDETPGSADNYMILKTKKKIASFVFNSYKNATKLGRQIVPIPNELRNIILKWKDKNPGDYLLVNRKGNHVTQSYVTQTLNNIFGANISSSLLRHIFVTKEFGNVDLQHLDNVTKDMGNSEISRTLKYSSKENAEK